MKRVLRNARRGLTLVEVVVSSMLVASVLITSLFATASWRQMHHQDSERETMRWLANELIAEIASVAFTDPSNIESKRWGLEPGEPANNRRYWNDVDDYHGLSESAPRYRDGSMVEHAEGFHRSASVQAADLALQSPGYIAAKDVHSPLRMIKVVVTSPSGLTWACHSIASNVATSVPADFRHHRSLQITVRQGDETASRFVGSLNQMAVE